MKKVTAMLLIAKSHGFEAYEVGGMVLVYIPVGDYLEYEIVACSSIEDLYTGLGY